VPNRWCRRVENVTAALRATVDERLRGFGGEGLVEPVVVVVDAIDGGCGFAGAARVPGDDVEVVEDVAAEVVRGVLGKRTSGCAGSTRVDKEHADSLV